MNPRDRRSRRDLLRSALAGASLSPWIAGSTRAGAAGAVDGPAPFVRVTDETGGPLDVRGGPVDPPGGRFLVETDRVRAAIATRSYVSGVVGGSFIDRKTGARDLGHGLSIVDFLLEPAPEGQPATKGQYEVGDLFHGNLPKRYVEGPQICTQARRLPAEVTLGDGFVVVRFKYRWNVAYPPRGAAGSVWEQTLVFPRGERYFLSADRVTVALESPELFLRIDMPGHIKHKGASDFDRVYLSYHDPSILAATEFKADFPPDARFLYRRGVDRKPERFIRAYRVNLHPGREPGPWLAGMTLNPGDVYQAWCHERGYVCMIEEVGGRPVRPGDTFGACYLVGWFDDMDEMNRAYDRHRGFSGLSLVGPADRPVGFRGLSSGDLTPVSI